MIQQMTELPLIMASLDIDDQRKPCTITEESTSKSYQCNQKRRSFILPDGSSKRRCNIKPKKLDTSAEEEEVNTYFLNKKKSCFAVKTLETIYEEPKPTKEGGVSYTGALRQRRIEFNITKAKLRKRKVKVKRRFTGSKMIPKRRLDIEEFVTRLQCLLSNSNYDNETSPQSISSLSSNCNTDCINFGCEQ